MCIQPARRTQNLHGQQAAPEPGDQVHLVCPICVDAKPLDKDNLLPNADVGGTVVMRHWIGDDGATTFSY
jgi:hypothetical protein